MPFIGNKGIVMKRLFNMKIPMAKNVFSNVSLISFSALFTVFIFLLCSYHPGNTSALQYYLPTTKWGQFGSGQGLFDISTSLACPYRIELNPSSGNVYIAEWPDNVTEFTSSGTFVKLWASKLLNITSDNICSNSKPVSMSFDKLGNAYVVNSNLVNDQTKTIMKFDLNGRLTANWNIEPIDLKDNSAGNIQSIVVDPVSSNVFVLTSNGVQIFDSGGKFLKRWDWGFEPPFKIDLQFVQDIAIDSSQPPNVYVLASSKVQKFDSEGKPVGDWDLRYNNSLAFGTPSAIATDKEGNIYVTDSDNNLISKFSSNGVSLGRFGSSCVMSTGKGCVEPDGSGPLSAGDGQFNSIEDMAIDSSGKLYLLDSGNERVQVFAPNSSPSKFSFIEPAIKLMGANTSLKNGMISYHDQNNGFSIEYPKDWNLTQTIDTITKKVTGITLAPANPPKHAISHKIPTLEISHINSHNYITNETKSLDDIVKDILTYDIYLHGHNPTYSSKGEIKVAKINGGDESFNRTATVMTKGNQAFSLEFEAPSEDYSNLSDDVEKIITSFRFLN